PSRLTFRRRCSTRRWRSNRSSPRSRGQACLVHLTPLDKVETRRPYYESDASKAVQGRYGRQGATMPITGRKTVRFAGAVAALVVLPRLAAAQAPPEPITFTKHIAPILQRSCQHCHRPGSIAPMSLLTYEDARPWAKAIKRRTAAREMPPWFVEK